MDIRKLDDEVARLQDAAPRFARLSIKDRIALARSMQAGFLRIAEQSVLAACGAKGIQPGTPVEGDEWAAGPWSVVRHLRLISESLASIERAGNAPVTRDHDTADGRVALRLIPASGIDRILYSGITVGVHLLAGIGASEEQQSRAAFYRGRPHDGRTVLVLGAGNLSGIPPMDVITKMFNEGKVCLLKMHPVNAYLGPLFEEAFRDAIRQNFLAIAYGGAEDGAYLAQHAGIDEIHLTGSNHTYDAMVWGPPGPERESRMARKVPVLSKAFTAELGNITPVLFAPGPYTDTELAFQAESIAGSVTHNASFNCNSSKMLVTPKGWARRKDLLASIERTLSATPVRRAYYPGAEERWHALTDGRTSVKRIGTPTDGELPWTLLPGLDATDPREPAFSTEPFCSILSETAVGGDDPVEFLERAVDFANNRLWGTLAANIVVHPASLKDPRISQALERAIARLRYGMVAVNSWSGFIFTAASPPWGAYPGSAPTDIQSGTGWVHNTSMIEGVEKVVLRHPLIMRPKPVAFPSHRTRHTLLRRLTALDEHESWSKVPGVVAAAMMG